MTGFSEAAGRSRLPAFDFKASILLVDDHPANLLALRALLGGLGQVLVDAGSGEEALQRMQSTEFAVVLLDVMMPGMDGFETARAIRGSDNFRHTPIIFLSACEFDGAQLEAGYALGAVDFLLKPIVPIILQAKVSGFVRLFIEKQLARRESSQFRLLVESTKDYAIFLLDPEGRVASWNPGAERIKQYRPEEIIGKHFSIFYPNDAIERGWPDRELNIARGDGRFEEEGWRRRKDGTYFWANVVITALHDEAGKLSGFSKITRDVTERKKAEENALSLVEQTTARRIAEQNARHIREQRERLRVTLASIADAVISTDADGQVEFLNPVAEDLIGWTSEEATGRRLEEVFHIVSEESRLPVDCRSVQELRDGAVDRLANHAILIARDGSERPIDNSAAPIRDAQGDIVGAVFVFRDVSERRRAEQASRRNQEILKLIHKIGKIGHWEWNAVTDENKWSPEIEAVYGLPPGGFKGTYQDWLDLLHPDDVANAERDVQRAMETGEYFSEFRVIWPDGTVHWLETRAHVFKDEFGRPVRIMGVNMDFTDRKNIEEALRDVDRRKDEFLATLAHELRNPLAPIRNSLQILKTPNVNSATIARLTEMMERQVRNLVRLVDDLLDVSRVMRGKIELRKELVALADIIAGAVETAQPLIESHGHDFAITLPSEPLLIEADPVRLVQIVGNLLNNAAKYTEPNGRIRLTARRENDRAILSIKDNGIGIAPEMLRHIFELFVQVDQASTRTQGGLGVGLTLVNSLVEIHGGSIQAFSDGLGKGSEFVVQFPLAFSESLKTAGGDPVEQNRVTPNTGYSILVVDDNEDAAMSLAMLLGLHGHRIQVAHNGFAALEIAKTDSPDMIFLDIGMPGMDGYEVARQMRLLPGMERILLVALTGWGQPTDRLRSAEAGFNHHLVKPPEPEALGRVLAELQKLKR